MSTIPETIAKIMWKGKPSWLYSDGTILPVIAGGADDDGGNGDSGGDSTSTNTDAKDEPKFTQTDLNRLLAREKSDGKRVGQAELLQTLGVSNLDEAKAILEAAREAEAKNLSEAEKAKKEAEAAKAKADEDSRTATAIRMAAMVERALLRAGLGIDDKDGDEQLELVARMVIVEPDSDQDAVNAAVADLKKKMPQLFESTGKAPEPKTPGSDPGRQPRNAGGKATPADQARSVLAARHPGKVKTAS